MRVRTVQEACAALPAVDAVQVERLEEEHRHIRRDDDAKLGAVVINAQCKPLLPPPSVQRASEPCRCGIQLRINLVAMLNNVIEHSAHRRHRQWVFAHGA